MNKICLGGLRISMIKIELVFKKEVNIEEYNAVLFQSMCGTLSF